MSRVAAVDIGTNTVRLLVAEEGRPVLRAHRVVSLGEGVDASRRFLPAAIDRTVAGLAELKAEAGAVGALDAVATSATRDAANRDEFLDRAEQVLGVRPRVISGAEEARLSFMGAIGGSADGRVGVVDVGGGSTEVVVGMSAPERAVSVDVGSIRITERVLADRPAAPHLVDAALAWAADRFEVAGAPADAPVVFGVGGTFTALAAIDADLEAYDESVVHGWRLELGRMERHVAWLAGLDLAATESIPSLEPARAPMLLGGAVTVLAVMRHLDVGVVEVRVTDLLDALVADLVAR